MEREDLRAIRVVERQLLREHLVEHHADGVEVRAGTGGLARGLLGRHVLRRAEDRAVARDELLAVARRGMAWLDLRDAEIEHLHEVGVRVLLDEHDVVGLEVAMDDAGVVRLLERDRDLAHDVERTRGLDRPLRDHFVERDTLDVFEDEKERAVGELAEVGRRGDVRMLDPRRGLGFATKAPEHLFVVAQVGVQQLQRHALSHQRVLREEHGAHPAFADQLVEAVTLRDHRADQGKVGGGRFGRLHRVSKGT